MRDPKLPNGYVITKLGPLAASLLGSRDEKAVLLSYRYDGKIYPISIFFFGGDEEILFCHSMLLLDSYAGNNEIVPRLRKAAQEFFSKDAEALLGSLEPTWTNVPLRGQSDRRILWNMKPSVKIAVDLFLETLGEIPEIPLFPSVYSYNNPYVENLMEVSLPDLKAGDGVPVLGTGAGLEAACIVLKYDICVDATDINPISAPNTVARAGRIEVDSLVHAWVSDGFNEVRGTYDAILFQAPLATEEALPKDPNRYDFGGKLLREVLAALPSHLNSGGRMYLMSRPDLSPYFSTKGLGSRVRRYFEAKSSMAIHEIWLEKPSVWSP